MLIQPDKLRKVLILIFSLLFVFLAIQVRFDMLFIHVIDNGATLIIQNLMPRHLQWWITFGASFAHYWIALPIMGILASLLYLMNYKIAMWWLITTQVLVMILVSIISFVLKIHWIDGFKLGPAIPNLLLLWWLQIFAICEVVIVPRLISDQRVRLFMTVCAVMLWMAMLVACIQKYNIPLSSGLGSLFFGYFWWQFSEEQYRKRANHWRRVLEIDTLI